MIFPQTPPANADQGGICPAANHSTHAKRTATGCILWQSLFVKTGLVVPALGVRGLLYPATPSQKRIRMVAIWAREALPAGFKVSSSMPWMMFSATAQAMASRA